MRNDDPTLTQEIAYIEGLQNGICFLLHVESQPEHGL